jgi:hypothetical protein
MEPPIALDAVMEPMRRSAPARERRVRPVYRWLGAAAAVVLGVTVATEVARRNPRPDPDRAVPARVVHQDEEEIFQLAPLPSAVPSENRPFGATDRLREEPPHSPEAPEPAPLEIMGPLPSGDVTTESDAALREPAHKEKAAARKRQGADDGTGPAPRAAGRPAGRVQENEQPARQKRAAPAHSVAIVVDGVHVWAGWSRCPAEDSVSIRIRVRGGLVVDITADPDADHRGRELCLPSDLVGSRVTGVPDGEHGAAIVAGSQ